MPFRLRSFSKRKNQEYDEDPTIIRLVINERLRNLSTQLASTLGAMLVISTMRKRKVVSKLFLGDNSFGDAGCVPLFAFLNSPPGLHYRETLILINLTNNKIGAKGLRALSTFLKDNTVLRELYLSENPLTTDSYVITEFANAINSSHLYALEIKDCSSLGDAFIQVFMPRLSTSYLRELDISALNLTQDIVPILVDYVKSPRCLLNILYCHNNSLTAAGSRKIIDAVEGNYCLRALRLNDKHIVDVVPYGLGSEERMIALLEGHQILRNILRRNSDQMERVRDDSLLLLRYCRTLLMCSRSTRMNKGVPIFDPNTLARPDDDKSLLITRLPIELQVEIFSY